MFGCCKTFSGKYIFSGNANFRKRKIFLCVWLYFKKFSGKYFLVFGKEEGKHKSRKTQATTQKKTSTTTRSRSRSNAIDDAIAISIWCDLATPSIAIDDAIAISIRRDLAMLSIAIDDAIAISIRRDLTTPLIAIDGEIVILLSDASPLACTRSLSLSLSFSGNALKGK